jgi:hypothetical protein
VPRKATTKYVAVYMSDEAIDTLKTLSKQKGFKAVGEYVRDLIKRDIESEGEEIDFGLDEWGGPGRKTPTNDEK